MKKVTDKTEYKVWLKGKQATPKVFKLSEDAKDWAEQDAWKKTKATVNTDCIIYNKDEYSIRTYINGVLVGSIPFIPYLERGWFIGNTPDKEM